MDLERFGGGNARQESYDVFADDRSINRYVIVQNTVFVKIWQQNVSFNNQYYGLGIPVITVTHMARMHTNIKSLAAISSRIRNTIENSEKTMLKTLITAEPSMETFT